MVGSRKLGTFPPICPRARPRRYGLPAFRLPSRSTVDLWIARTSCAGVRRVARVTFGDSRLGRRRLGHDVFGAGKLFQFCFHGFHTLGVHRVRLGMLLLLLRNLLHDPLVLLDQLLAVPLLLLVLIRFLHGHLDSAGVPREG